MSHWWALTLLFIAGSAWSLTPAERQRTLDDLEAYDRQWKELSTKWNSELAKREQELAMLRKQSDIPAQQEVITQKGKEILEKGIKVLTKAGKRDPKSVYDQAKTAAENSIALKSAFEALEHITKSPEYESRMQAIEKEKASLEAYLELAASISALNAQEIAKIEATPVQDSFTTWLGQILGNAIAAAQRQEERRKAEARERRIHREPPIDFGGRGPPFSRGGGTRQPAPAGEMPSPAPPRAPAPAPSPSNSGPPVILRPT